jgi:hypothetical protein
MNARHDVEWIPPENLDTGQARVNNYHRPERLLRPPADPPANGDNQTQSAEQFDSEGQDPLGGQEDDEPGGPEPNAA